MKPGALHDDHTENLAFVYRDGRWALSPAFDLSFAFLPDGGWLPNHQMTIAGSVHGADRATLLELADRAKVAGAASVIDDVIAAVARWPEHAAAAGVGDEQAHIVATELAAARLAKRNRNPERGSDSHSVVRSRLPTPGSCVFG